MREIPFPFLDHVVDQVPPVFRERQKATSNWFVDGSSLSEDKNGRKRASDSEEGLEPSVFYDRAAPYYDDVIMKPFKQRFTEESEAQFLSSIFPEGSRLLDLGSGTGRSIALLQGRSCQVSGIDISLGMIQKAIGRGVRASVLGGISRLPYKSQAFDGAFSIHGGLSHLRTPDDKFSALQEIDRTLKDGSVLMIDVPNPYRKDRGVSYVVEWLAGDHAIRVKGYGWYPEQFREMCSRLGFSEIKFLGDYAMDRPFDQNSRRLVVLARRTKSDTPSR